MSSSSGNNNKFFKHQNTSPNSAAINQSQQHRDSSSSDRMVWEMRNNYRQYYRNHTPNLTPLLNSPILNDDIRIIDQYQKVTSDINSSDSNGLRVLDSQIEGASNFYTDKDIVVFDDIDVDDSRGGSGGPWLNSSYANRLVTGFSPTSSHSSHSGGSDGLSSKNRIIGDIQIADLQGSPRRFGSTHSNGQQSPTDSTIAMEKSDKYQQSQRGILHSPINFPSKRAPGFPKVS